MPQEGRQNPLIASLRENLPGVLPDFLVRQRWFGGKARAINSAEILETVQIPFGGGTAFVVLARVKYAEGNDEAYAIPLIQIEPGRAPAADATDSKTSLKLDVEGGEKTFKDAFQERGFAIALYESIRGGKSFKGSSGGLSARPTSGFRDGKETTDAVPEPSLMKGEQSNTSVRYGERFILKFFRRLEQGMNPDVEIGTFLTEKAQFKHSPVVRGTLEFRDPQSRTCALGILQDFVPNQGDAWRYTLSSLEKYLEATATKAISSLPEMPGVSILESAHLQIPADVPAQIGPYWESAGLLGRRTGELHVALASDPSDPEFRPETFSTDFQQSQHESMRGLALRVVQVLEKRLATLPESIRGEASKVLQRKKNLLDRFEVFANLKMTAECIRIHGDYHLGQVLYTGSDFVIIDFEGEPARPLEERRKKRCALQDVAGMLRSFHYAAYAAFFSRESAAKATADASMLLAWARYWQGWISVRFLKGYLSAAAGSRFLPSSGEELAVLLQAYLLEKAVYELGYELNNRPDWVRLPIQGILELLET